MTTTHPRTSTGAIVTVTYVAGILAANLLSTTWPTLDLLSLTVPAGTFAAGLVLTFRDLVHDTLGSRAAAAAVLVGTGLAWLTASPQIAAASAVAFAVSETVDAIVYAMFRAQAHLAAVATSNLAGLVIDSLLFVPLAFGTLTAVPGQLIAKTAATVLSVSVLAMRRRDRSAR